MSDLAIQLDADWHFRSERNQVEGRIVPFDEPTVVVEDGEVYREVFDHGSLTYMEQYAHNRGNAAWIGLNLEHDESLPARIGYARTLVQRDDGGYATFQLYDGPDLGKVRQMLKESHTGLSVYFRDRVPPVEIDGIRHRVQVNVAHVAATPLPTYAGAQITAVRHTVDVLDVTPALDEWDAWLASQSG